MKGLIALLGLLVLTGCTIPDIPQMGASEVHFTLSEEGSNAINYLLSERDEYNTEAPFTTVFHATDSSVSVKIENPQPQRYFLRITRYDKYGAQRLVNIRYYGFLTGDAYTIEACRLSDSTVVATRTVWILRNHRA